MKATEILPKSYISRKYRVIKDLTSFDQVFQHVILQETEEAKCTTSFRSWQPQLESAPSSAVSWTSRSHISATAT